MDLLTIIVPVYNQEALLERCLTSLQGQMYKNLEVLLIDDGSTDNSSNVCREFCKRDSRFHYYYKENGGVSSARNYGMAKANGRYISFCDSDDWVESAYYETMVNSLRESGADLVIAGMQLTDGKQIFEHFFAPEDRLYTKGELAKSFWEPNLFTLWNSLCNKVYLRSNIQFSLDTSMTCGEDMAFNMKYFMTTEKVSIIKNAGYFYYTPALENVKYSRNDARQCNLYSESVRAFLSSALEEEVYMRPFNRFVAENVCRDSGLLAKGKDYQTARKMIREFYQYPLLKNAIKSGAWRASKIRYTVVGMLLYFHFIDIIIIIAKLTGGDVLENSVHSDR